MNQLLQSLLAALVLACIGTTAQAQPYPNKPIRMIVPFPAGGAADLSARIVVQALAAGLGQQIIIDNRAGAGGQTRAVNRGPLAGCERP